jgi:hypothetical protein
MKSTIILERATRELLKMIGRKGQTYDQLIVELIKSKENNQDSLDSRHANLASSESTSA